MERAGNNIINGDGKTEKMLNAFQRARKIELNCFSGYY